MQELHQQQTQQTLATTPVASPAGSSSKRRINRRVKNDDDSPIVDADVLREAKTAALAAAACPSDTLLLKNLPFELTLEELERRLNEFHVPAISCVFLIEDSLFKGIATARYPSVAMASHALSVLAGEDLGGRKLYVEFQRSDSDHLCQSQYPQLEDFDFQTVELRSFAEALLLLSASQVAVLSLPHALSSAQREVLVHVCERLHLVHFALKEGGECITFPPASSCTAPSVAKPLARTPQKQGAVLSRRRAVDKRVQGDPPLTITLRPPLTPQDRSPNSNSRVSRGPDGTRGFGAGRGAGGTGYTSDRERSVTPTPPNAWTQRVQRASPSPTNTHGRWPNPASPSFHLRPGNADGSNSSSSSSSRGSATLAPPATYMRSPRGTPSRVTRAASITAPTPTPTPTTTGMSQGMREGSPGTREGTPGYSPVTPTATPMAGKSEATRGGVPGTFGARGGTPGYSPVTPTPTSSTGKSGADGTPGRSPVTPADSTTGTMGSPLSSTTLSAAADDTPLTPRFASSSSCSPSTATSTALEALSVASSPVAAARAHAHSARTDAVGGHTSEGSVTNAGSNSDSSLTDANNRSSSAGGTEPIDNGSSFTSDTNPTDANNRSSSAGGTGRIDNGSSTSTSDTARTHAVKGSSSTSDTSPTDANNSSSSATSDTKLSSSSSSENSSDTNPTNAPTNPTNPINRNNSNNSSSTITSSTTTSALTLTPRARASPSPPPAPLLHKPLLGTSPCATKGAHNNSSIA